MTPIPVLTGKKVITDEAEAWNRLRNPLPARRENTLFDQIHGDLELKGGEFTTEFGKTPLRAVPRALCELQRKWISTKPSATCATRYPATSAAAKT